MFFKNWLLLLCFITLNCFDSRLAWGKIPESQVIALDPNLDFNDPDSYHKFSQETNEAKRKACAELINQLNKKHDIKIDNLNDDQISNLISWSRLYFDPSSNKKAPSVVIYFNVNAINELLKEHGVKVAAKPQLKPINEIQKKLTSKYLQPQTSALTNNNSNNFFIILIKYKELAQWREIEKALKLSDNLKTFEILTASNKETVIKVEPKEHNKDKIISDLRKSFSQSMGESNNWRWYIEQTNNNFEIIVVIE